MVYPGDNPVLYRRQQTNMLEGCVARAAVIVCADAANDPTQDCSKRIESSGEPEVLASDAYKQGWRTSATEEARVAYCKHHAIQRGLLRQ